MSSDKRKHKPLYIAILTSAGSASGFKGNRGNFRDLLKAAKAMKSTAYVVTAPALLEALSGARSADVRGYAYDSRRKHWFISRFPFPHVVYNRMPSRADEKSSVVQELNRRLENNAAVRFFNPRFFNKWQLTQWLEQSSELKKYVPHTEPLRNSQSLKFVLDRHKRIFLKPIHGKAGAGMMSIVQRSERTWLLISQGKQKSNIQQFTRFRTLWLAVRKRMRGKSYVVQQFISLAKANGLPFDLRMLLQKNRHGQWTVTGIGARVAGSGSMTTHVPRGGSIASPLSLLRRSHGDERARQLLQEAGKLGAKIAGHIESQSARLLGEMSMDIGLDDQDRLWFFEANARPMKFDEPTIRRRSLRKWVRYCHYLANRR